MLNLIQHLTRSRIKFGMTPTFKPKAAFTMAETLITLAIIGIIASLTIPNLMSGYRKSVVENRLKSALSIITNSFKQAEYEYGAAADWELISPNNSSQMLMIVKKYYAPYIKFEKIIESNGGVLANLPNGSAMYFYKKWTNNQTWSYGTYIYYCIDSKYCKPNTTIAPNGKTIFAFYTGGGTGISLAHLYTRDELIANCKNNLNTYVESCTTLIWLAGMRIPNDYPYKL